MRLLALLSISGVPWGNPDFLIKYFGAAFMYVFDKDPVLLDAIMNISFELPYIFCTAIFLVFTQKCLRSLFQGFRTFYQTLFFAPRGDLPASSRKNQGAPLGPV